MNEKCPNESCPIHYRQNGRQDFHDEGGSWSMQISYVGEYAIWTDFNEKAFDDIQPEVIAAVVMGIHFDIPKVDNEFLTRVIRVGAGAIADLLTENGGPGLIASTAWTAYHPSGADTVKAHAENVTLAELS